MIFLINTVKIEKIFYWGIICIYQAVTFDVFHFEISGNDSNDLQLQNIPHILLTLEVFQFDISGNDVNDSQLLKIQRFTSSKNATHVIYIRSIPI